MAGTAQLSAGGSVAVPAVRGTYTPSPASLSVTCHPTGALAVAPTPGPGCRPVHTHQRALAAAYTPGPVPARSACSDLSVPRRGIHLDGFRRFYSHGAASSRPYRIFVYEIREMTMPEKVATSPWPVRIAPLLSQARTALSPEGENRTSRSGRKPHRDIRRRKPINHLVR